MRSGNGGVQEATISTIAFALQMMAANCVEVHISATVIGLLLTAATSSPVSATSGAATGVAVGNTTVGLMMMVYVVVRLVLGILVLVLGRRLKLWAVLYRLRGCKRCWRRTWVRKSCLLWQDVILLLLLLARLIW